LVEGQRRRKAGDGIVHCNDAAITRVALPATPSARWDQKAHVENLDLAELVFGGIDGIVRGLGISGLQDDLHGLDLMPSAFLEADSEGVSLFVFRNVGEVTRRLASTTMTR
jgi:hypothetical protein